MEPLEQKLTDLSTEVKSFATKAKEEITNLGAVTTETKTALDAIRSQMTAQQTQLDAIDAKSQNRHVTGPEYKTLGMMMTEHPDLLAAKSNEFVSRKPINMSFSASAFGTKASTDAITIGAVGTGTSGVQMPVRLPGMVALPKQALRIRDVMTEVMQNTGNSFDYIKQATRSLVASPQVEMSPKSQSNITWSSQIGNIRTIAHWMQISKQALADIPWARAQVDEELTYGLKLKEEAEILSGDGTNEHLNGILTQATAFDTSLLSASAGFQRIDILRWAKLQARLAGLATYAPSAFVLHPTDMARLETTKSNYGEYILGEPKSGTPITMVWGLPVVESDSIASGTFLTGSFDNGAVLIDRQQLTIEISFEHNVNFTTNAASILAEERLGLAVKVPGAFVKGSFSTSPATQS
jgi:HK97 family phage major capsid protein